MLTSVDLNKANGHPIAVEGDSAMSIHDGQWYRVCSRSKWAHTVSKLSRFLWQGKNKSLVKVYGELRVMKEKKTFCVVRSCRYSCEWLSFYRVLRNSYVTKLLARCGYRTDFI